VKFPFCFYRERVDLNDYTILLGVRFRYQFHPKMNTNTSYDLVYFHLADNILVVWDNPCSDYVCLANKPAFTVEMELHVKPVDPHVN
jgi:hypothetical protein